MPVTNAYTNGWLTSIRNQSSYYYGSSIGYHPNGMFRTSTHGNGMVSTVNPDPNKMGRPASITASYSGVNNWTSGTFAYDGSGNIRAIGADWYIYDRLNRLIEGTSEGGVKRQNLTIDPYGNITRNTTRVNGVIDADRTMVVSTATNRLAAGGTDFGTYDQWGGGNLVTHNGIWTYGYDRMGMVRRVTGGGKDFAYVYTADEQRLWELNPSLSRGEYSLRNLDGKTLRVFKEDSFAVPVWSWKQDYIHRGSTLHSGSLAAGGIIHYHLDHLGTPRYVTNASRAQFGRHAYYPFGEESTLQSQNAEEAKFTGHERDTNFVNNDRAYLDYMHARYYSPVMGRFLSVDPVLDQKTALKNPQTWNRYSYVSNNPVRFTDPTGKYQCEGSRNDCAAVRNAYNDIRRAATNLPRNSSERRSLNAVLSFLGKPGQANGVTVTVGAGTIPGAAGGASITRHTAPVGPTGFTTQIGLNLEGRSSPSFAPELASTLAHEAQHGMDQRAIGRMHANAAEVRATETNAWTTDAAVYRGLNFESVWRTWTRAGGFDAEAVQRGVERSVQDWCNAGGNCQ